MMHALIWGTIASGSAIAFCFLMPLIVFIIIPGFCILFIYAMVKNWDNVQLVNGKYVYDPTTYTQKDYKRLNKCKATSWIETYEEPEWIKNITGNKKPTQYGKSPCYLNKVLKD